MSVFPVHATPGTGGWPDLSRQGLSPCRKHQALLGALTPKFRWPVKIVGDHQPRSISALRDGAESLNPDCQIRAGIRSKFRCRFKIVGDHQPRSILTLRNGAESLNPDCQIRAGITPKFRWPVKIVGDHQPRSISALRGCFRKSPSVAQPGFGNPAGAKRGTHFRTTPLSEPQMCP